ncbi:membrane-fusion protein [Paramagnetospirillum marisnigri]|uniref:Membrane-fusion protein n=1 Tax=Paramagnetospirillum marisnigri TaxID=1285242 RepID=A0A178MXN7_9PROT|nr:efflux RND transporter periplasmic adaptor subunit [Paramagnetospirillum marisnigri]OAN55967.1 membrane-fusion protein [Paramagnetospirillum marisnigri]
MPRRLFSAAVLAAGLAIASMGSFAHDGIDHSLPNAPSHGPAAQKANFGAEGEAFQAVLVPSAEGGSLLYLAEADSNAPVANAAIEAEAGPWRGVAAPTNGEGVYTLAWAPMVEAVDLSLVISVGERSDLVLIQGVRQQQTPGADPTDASVAHWTHWMGGGAIGAVVVAVVLGLRRKASVAALILLISIPPALAHGGEDHGAPSDPKPQAQPGEPIVMSKPTQFLLGIRTERIEPREAADTVRVMGRVIPDPSGYARVQPSQPARIVADPAFPIPVPGQIVKRGQVLAVLEPTLTNLERGDKRSSLTRIDSELNITQRELARQEALGPLVPVKQVETTRIRLDQLRRERAQIAGTSLGREYLTAPLDGIVTDVHVVPGEVVGPAQSLAEVVDVTRLRVEAVIHDLHLARRVAGAMATTKLLPGQTFALTLLGRSPKLDPQDQGIHAIFQVNSDRIGELGIGMPVDVYLATGAIRMRTAVPRDAIAELGGRQVVFVRTAPESFEARPIKIDRMVGPLAEITEGVNPGDRVVTQGIAQLKAGR